MQQHCQAQMQRLLEALAKKGYGGLEDSSVHTGSHSANAQRPQQAGQGTAGTAALQQQQQELQPVLQRAFCAKVCDFGFSKCLRAGQSHCSTASAGTITHQAPEVLRHGHLSPAADVYAFGIICECGQQGRNQPTCRSRTSSDPASVAPCSDRSLRTHACRCMFCQQACVPFALMHTWLLSRLAHCPNRLNLTQHWWRMQDCASKPCLMCVLCLLCDCACSVGAADAGQAFQGPPGGRSCGGRV